MRVLADLLCGSAPLTYFELDSEGQIVQRVLLHVHVVELFDGKLFGHDEFA